MSKRKELRELYAKLPRVKCKGLCADQRGLPMKLNEQKSGFDIEITEEERERANALLAFLAKHAPENTRGVRGEPSLYFFRDPRGVLRISEFGFTWGSGGGVWMRSDLDAQGAVLAAEDYLIWYDRAIDEVDSESYVDLAQEAERGVLYHILGADINALPEWEDRR